MWRVGELLRTALSLFGELRKPAEDVAESHTGPDSFFLFEFGEIIREEKLWIQLKKNNKKNLIREAEGKRQHDVEFSDEK